MGTNSLLVTWRRTCAEVSPTGETAGCEGTAAQHGGEVLWDTQTADQAVGTGVLVGRATAICAPLARNSRPWSANGWVVTGHDKPHDGANLWAHQGLYIGLGAL